MSKQKSKNATESYKQLSPQCLEVRIPYEAGTAKEFLLLSDLHFDNPYCVRQVLFDHLEEARKRGAKVLCFGDTFCFMQGKYDPRRNKSSIREEHNVANYIDAVIADTANIFEEYKDVFLMFSDGNHETSILKRLETDPTQRLCDLMNSNGAQVFRGRYWGYVRFKFVHKGGGNIQTKNLFFHHGAWGGVITKGALSTTRFASIHPTADIIYSGHTHDKWSMDHDRFHLNANGSVELKPQIHLKGGTYKEEFLKADGWANERIVMPKSIGGHWLKFSNIGGTIYSHTEKTLVTRPILSKKLFELTK